MIFIVLTSSDQRFKQCTHDGKQRLFATTQRYKTKLMTRSMQERTTSR